MLSALHQRGFTLVELLVGITVLGVLIGLGAPAMGNYLQNSKLASVASSYFAGIQMARAEAIRRNVRTEFVLTNDAVSIPDIANAVLPAAGGRNWVVRAATPPAGFASAVEAKAGAEGEGSAGATAIVVNSSGSIIPFSGFGATADGAAYTINITNPSKGTCAALGGPVRCRRINVSPGGQVTSCDPAATAPEDSRAC